MKQRPITHEVPGLYLEIALIAVAPSDFSAQLGVAFERDCDQLDWFLGAIVELDNGRPVFLQYYERAPTRGTIVNTLDDGSDPNVELANVLSALGLGIEEVIWTPEFVDISKVALRHASVDDG